MHVYAGGIGRGGSGAEEERVSQLRLLSSAPKNNRKIGNYGETLEPVERWQPDSGGWGG